MASPMICSVDVAVDVAADVAAMDVVAMDAVLLATLMDKP
jgi:hypothetical protein